MNMEGWRFVVDVGIATVVAVLLGSVLSFIFNAWVDSKGWKKVKEKIGDTSRGSLNIQHEDIKNVITIRTEGIEKVIVEKTSNINTKVEKINDITVKNEFLYQNLNQDQREVRDNINRLIYDWEKTVSENKEFESQIDYLKHKKHELMVDRDKAKEKLDKLETAMEENAILKHNNTNLKCEVDSLKNKNGSLINQNKELLNTNKDLLKKLDTAKRMLGIENIPQEQDNDLNKEKEDDWDLEL